MTNGAKEDWLVHNVTLESDVIQGENPKEIIISNGLVSRTFGLTPNCATVYYTNLGLLLKMALVIEK